MEMDDDIVVKFLQGKTILVTGATGFLAKVFVEKILRLQPNINKLYLLLRASDHKSVTQRLYNEIINTELFRILREKWGSEFDSFVSSKVVAVAGDISCENLGVKDLKLRQEMWKETEIVVNMAATTDFYGRYDVALDINTFGTLNVFNFGKKCDKIKLFLHISTAYVCGEQSGMILENRFLKETDNINIFEEKRMVEEKLNQLQFHSNKTITSLMKEFGLKRARLNGWPNTYVFTKAMGEMVLGKFKGGLPVVIMRPTMISSTYKDPFPGWIEGVRTIDSVIVNYGKGKLRCFLGSANSALDVIPVDMVVNAMLVAMKIHYANYDYPCETIYHVSSSFRNPLIISELMRFLHNYFTQNPSIDRNGQEIKVDKLILFTIPDLFFLYMQIKYVLPLKLLYLVNILSCQRFRQIYENLNRKIKFAIQLAKFYKPYVFFKGIFNDENLEKLQRASEEEGIDLLEYNFDVKSIDWKDYITKVHIPGLSTHVIQS